MSQKTTRNVLIRPLESPSDFRAFEQLQREVWGEEIQEVVNGSLAEIVRRIGGIAAGAFDASGVLLGFVFGFTGYKMVPPFTGRICWL